MKPLQENRLTTLANQVYDLRDQTERKLDTKFAKLDEAVSEIKDTTKEIKGTFTDTNKRLGKIETGFEELSDEVVDILKEIKSTGLKGDPGNNADEEAIEERLLAKIPTMEELVKEIPTKDDIIKEVIKQIPQSKPSLKVIQESIDIDQVVEKVEEKLNKKPLEIHKVNGLQGKLDNILRDLARGGYHGGGDVVKAGTNVTITSDGTGAKVINSTGGTFSLTAWTANTAYTEESLVTQAGRLLQANSDFTSGAVYDATEAANWTLIQTAPITTWTGSTYYYANELVTIGTRTLRRTADGESNGAFTNTEAADWTLISNPVPSTWTADTYMYAGELFYSESTRLLLRITNGVSANTWDIVESAEYTVVKFITPSSYLANTIYYAGEEIFQDGLIYVRIATGVSTAVWNSTERANWYVESGVSTPVNTTSQVKTGDYTLVETDGLIRLSPSASTQTITLDAGLADGKEFGFSWTVDTAKTITFVASGGATITSPFTNVAVSSWTTADSGGLIDEAQLFIKFTKTDNNFNYTT